MLADLATDLLGAPDAPPAAASLSTKKTQSASIRAFPGSKDEKVQAICRTNRVAIVAVTALGRKRASNSLWTICVMDFRSAPRSAFGKKQTFELPVRRH